MSGSTSAGESQGTARRAPNVVMVVLDDLGFAQLGCYGADVETPAIDGLASRGLRYNRFHVTSLCSPTRACLLTGRNAHAVGMGYLPLPSDLPGYHCRIPPSAGTLPRLMRGAGYNTFAVGKWHLSPPAEETPAGPFDRWPLGMGFERYYGFLSGMTNQWTPDLVRDNGLIEPPCSPEDGYHLTEDLASQAIDFVRDQQQAAPGKPFFLYFAPGAVHSPHQVPDASIELYRGRFDDGWEAWRSRTFARQQELGVVPPGTTLTERPPWVASWESVSADERRVFARQMEVFAGFVTHTDAQIGRVLDALAQMGVLDDTIVMVLSDNGASAEGGPRGCFSRYELDEVGFMLEHLADLGGHRANNHYAWGWAWAGNTPFRLWKRYAWLGGVRTPLVVHWPAGIPAGAGGEVRSQFCHAVDLMPSILAAAGVEPPESLDGVSQQPFDGRSLLATFDDAGEPSPRATQYFEVMGSRAIYHDGWKATTDHVARALAAERELFEGSRDFETDRWSLYALDDDFSEAHDVAADHPERLRRMVELWWAEAGRNHVLPLMDAFERPLAADASHRLEQRYVLQPGSNPVATPSPFVSGFHLTADVELSAEGDDQGVICAQGDWHGGWACYVDAGRVCVAFNFGDGSRQLRTSQPLPKGRHALTVAYAPLHDGWASASVSVDGCEAARGRIPVQLTTALLLGLAGKLLIGRDSGFPVCEDYRPPSPFTGTIHGVVLEFARQPPPSRTEELTGALRSE